MSQSKSDNIEVMNHSNTDEFTEEIFQSVLSRCQIGLETSMKCSDFIFDCVNLFHYKRHKINFNHGGSNVVSLNWTKTKIQQEIILIKIITNAFNT